MHRSIVKADPPPQRLQNDNESRQARSGPSSRGRPFARSLPMQLMRARELVMRHFRPHLHDHDLTDQQWRIIRALMEAEAIEIGDLSARCCIHPASLSRILPKLETSGLVSRRSNADDKRRVTVSIAPQGRRLFTSMAPDIGGELRGDRPKAGSQAAAGHVPRARRAYCGAGRQEIRRPEGAVRQGAER